MPWSQRVTMSERTPLRPVYRLMAGSCGTSWTLGTFRVTESRTGNPRLFGGLGNPCRL